MGSPSFSFHAAQRWAPAVEIGFDLYARTRQTRHDGTDRHALHLGDFAVAQPLEHHEQQGVALVFNISFTIFSGTAPLVATTLIRDTGQVTSPAFLMIGSAVLALLGSLWVERYGGNVLKPLSEP